MEQPPLVVDNFGRRYGRRAQWAVRHVSLELAQGSVTILVGPNGAGKSTLLRGCVGFERADEGHIIVGGYDTAMHRARAVAQVGYVPQSTSLYRGLTVGDHLTIAEAARPAYDRDRARALIKAVGLTERRRVGQLSGGEQAQVAVALALGTNAPLLLLDEPLASLDPLARRELMTTLMQDVRGRGATALVSSHVITEVEQTCDRVLVIGRGTLVLDTPLAEAKARFSTVPVSNLNGALPVGTFAAPNGEQLALIEGSGVGRPASLEEIVLAHLSGVRIEPTH